MAIDPIRCRPPLFLFFLFLFVGIWSLAESRYIAYNTTQRIVPDKLNVHLVAHTHDDVGWLKTVDQYYVGSNNSIQGACVQNVLDSMVTALLADKNRKFIYVEMAFFQRWWRQQSNAIKNIVKELVSSGQLEFINGGMCMHDEAAVHYIDMIDQTTLGHRFIKQEFGQTPRIGWQIDPFGHSAVQAYLLSAEVGFDALYFSRIDYQDREKRKDLKSLEVVWRGSKTLGSSADIFTGIFPKNYEPPPGDFYFEVDDVSPVIQDDVLLFDYNVEERVNDFVAAAIAQANVMRTNHIMFTMGTDFKYQYATSWFRQLDKFIHYVNKDGRVNALYSTPSIYTDAKYAANESWPLKTDDFFPYADVRNAYWTGYFTSRPALKGYVRTMSAYYLAARQLEFLKGRNSSGPTTDSLADALAIAQHHDAVSGTEKQHVANDYAKRLSIGYAEAGKLVESSLACLTSLDSKSGCDKPARKFEQCPHLNISYCPPSELDLSTGKTLVVLIYYDMSKLRSKIISSFNLSSDAELILTYTDEDGDVVTLGDDDDLHDAIVSQHLNPLRINVQLKSGTGRHSDLESQTAKPTPKMSPQIENRQPHISFALDEALKSLPEPFHGALSKLSEDFFLKAVSSAPGFAEFIDYFSKLGLSNANQSSGSPLGDSSDTSIGASAQTVDVNIGDGPKVLNDSSSLSTVIPYTHTHTHTHTADPVSEVMQKHHESVYVNSGGRVKIPVDLNTDIPRNAHTPVYPPIDDLLTPMLTETRHPISATNDDINHDKETSDAHRKGKSIISAALFSLSPVDHTAEHNLPNYETQNPFLGRNYGITEIMNSDNSKPLPVGMTLSASNHGFSSPVDVPTNKHIGAPSADVPLPSRFFPIGHPYRRGDGYHESMHRTFHRGVQCDGCGIYPIIGPRFKSIVKEDYDLCGICFSVMGNEVDYIRIDKSSPISQRLYNDFHNTHSRYLLPSSHAVHGCGTRPLRAKLESHFVRDVTVLDGTLMPPSTPFTKIWRMCNNGTTPWPYGTHLVWVGGDQFANHCTVQLEIPVNGFPANTEIDIAVDFKAPSRPGRYVSYWRLASPSGQKFGQRVWVLIQVDMSWSISSSSNFPTDLNLNLPPESSGQNELGIIDVNADPLGGVGSEPSLPTTTSELVKPLVTEIPSKSAEPAASDAIVQPVPAVGSSVSYPLINFPACSSDASPVAVVQPSETIHDDNPVEQTLLKKLEEMGFEQINLNKEVLRLNDYNLEQSLDDLLDVKQINLNKEVLRLKENNLKQFVDDLCVSAEWDPLLAELQELGFSDNEINKKLLIKNGRSIKRVVLDLIAEEKGE